MRNTMKMAGLGIAFMGATTALAQEAEPMPAMPKLGVQYRYQMAYDDDGLNKDAKADIPQISHGLKAFRLLGEGKATDRLTYAFRAGMESGTLVFDYGYIRWSLGENHAILFGKQKTRVFGWEYRSSNPLTVFKSHGLATSPFGYTDMIAFENKYGWGMLTLQLTEDKAPTFSPKVAANTGATPGWSKDAAGNFVSKQPAFVLEYLGAFGSIKPILQFAMYDLGHSSLATGGLRFEAADFLAELDYTQHNIGAKGIKTGGTKEENLVSTSTTIALNMNYQVGQYKPFLHYSVYDMNEFTNPGQAKSSVNGAVGTFDDNGSILGIGTEYTAHGDAFRPYVAYMMESGKFPAVAGGDKTMSRNEILAGVKGQF